MASAPLWSALWGAKLSLHAPRTKRECGCVGAYFGIEQKENMPRRRVSTMGRLTHGEVGEIGKRRITRSPSTPERKVGTIRHRTSGRPDEAGERGQGEGSQSR